MHDMTRIHPAALKRARKLRAEMSDAERWLWRNLRKRQVGAYRFRRQHPLGRHIVDFVRLEARLVIEVDGGQHVEGKEYDRQRSTWLEQKGYRVLRFWNHEVLTETEAVLLAIDQVLQGRTQPPSPPSPCQGEGE
ncbi:MAG: endonuclease domain-containing protein [Gammaproteobacteria bacterium]